MSESTPAPTIRVVPAALAPLAEIWRQLRAILDVPLAFYGGVFGMIVLCAATVFFFLYMPGVGLVGEAEEEEEFLLDFEPGALVRLGKKLEDPTIKEIVEETRTEEAAVKETVTKKDEPPPEKKEEKKKEKQTESTEKPDPNKNKDVKVGKVNQEKNTPYNELPTVEQLSGDPFGDPQGWAKLKKDGDPWATAVMRALNGIKVPSFAAKSFNGQYRFELKICKDGRIDKVYTKKASGSADLDNAVKGELLRLKIPKPPSKIANKMKSPCVKLKYRFVWGKGVIN